MKEDFEHCGIPIDYKCATNDNSDEDDTYDG
jgi:hypothetical protein